MGEKDETPSPMTISNIINEHGHRNDSMVVMDGWTVESAGSQVTVQLSATHTP